VRQFIRIASPFWIGANVLLILLYLAGYVAYYGYTWRFWWVELLAVGMPVLAVVSIVALFVNALARKRVLIAIHAVLLALTIIRFNPLQRVMHTADPQPGDLTILTYNVPQWWGYVMGPKALEMAAFFQEVQPDVAALQEASMGFFGEEPRIRATPYVSILLDSLGYHPAEMATDTPVFTYQPVIGRVAFHEKNQSLLEHPDDYVGGTEVVRTQFEWQGREVVLYNVHMRTYGRDKPWDERGPEYLSPDILDAIPDAVPSGVPRRNWEVNQILRKIQRGASRHHRGRPQQHAPQLGVSAIGSTGDRMPSLSRAAAGA
jgi:hypothetical protein